MRFVMTGIAATIMLGVCGLSTFFIVVDERRGRDVSTAAVAPARLVDQRDISSRVVDPEPPLLRRIHHEQAAERPVRLATD